MQRYRDIIIVLGKTGHGKSRWTWEYLRTQPRVFAYDPIHEMPGMIWMNAQDVIEWHDQDQPSGFELPGERPRVQRKFRIATDDENSLETFGHLAFIRGDCIYAVEEASLVFEQGERISGWCKNIVFVGRHRNVSLLVTAQRAASIPIALRSQATRTVSFAQQEGDDLNWLKGVYGKERVQELPFLPRLTCFDSHDGELKCYSIAESPSVQPHVRTDEQ